MPNARNKAAEKSRLGRLQEKSMSFHGGALVMTSPVTKLRRPKTLPELLPFGKSVAGAAALSPAPRLTKLLLNLTIQGSVGALQVVMLPDSTVGDLISAAIRQYAKEGRRPFLPSSDPSCFDLHYSQFSLESLERDEKVMTLGSRNFFLCSKNAADVGSSGGGACSKEAEKVTKTGFHWLKFKNFSL